VARHCLKIPFLIGQRDDSIVGNSCADNPIWSAPCQPLDLEAVDCEDVILAEPPPKTLVLA
jgi:hypothetical protein